MKYRLHYEGQFRTAVWVPDEAGRFRGHDYFSAAAPADRARLQVLIERQCDFQIGVRNTTQFRLEADGIWAFKRYQDRLLCFFDGRLVCITHGLRKKQDKLKPTELDIARRIREHWLSQEH